MVLVFRVCIRADCVSGRVHTRTSTRSIRRDTPEGVSFCVGHGKVVLAIATSNSVIPKRIVTFSDCLREKGQPDDRFLPPAVV